MVSREQNTIFLKYCEVISTHHYLWSCAKYTVIESSAINPQNSNNVLYQQHTFLKAIIICIIIFFVKYEQFKLKRRIIAIYIFIALKLPTTIFKIVEFICGPDTCSQSLILTWYRNTNFRKKYLIFIPNVQILCLRKYQNKIVVILL